MGRLTAIAVLGLAAVAGSGCGLDDDQPLIVRVDRECSTRVKVEGREGTIIQWCGDRQLNYLRTR